MTEHREHIAAPQRREWQLQLATLAGCALVSWRAIGGLMELLADHGSKLDALESVLIAGICAVFVAFLRARERIAAVGLLGFWAIGYFDSWYRSGWTFTPFGLTSLLIGAGLAVGIHALSGAQPYIPGRDSHRAERDVPLSGK